MITLMLALGIVLACNDADLSGVDSSATTALESRSLAETVGHLSLAQRARARASMAWVGEIHAVAMKDLIENMDTWRVTEGTRREQVCRTAARLTEKYIPMVDSHIGVTRSPAARQALAQEVVSRYPLCNAGAASIFGLPDALPGTAAFASMRTDSLVTVDVIPYIYDR